MYRVGIAAIVLCLWLVAAGFAIRVPTAIPDSVSDALETWALPPATRAATTTATVVRVVDGDTVVVVLPSGQEETVRVIGIDTPETVRPQQPVECYGPEASAYAALLLLPQSTLTVVFDASQGERDTYGRLLAYLTLPDGRDFGVSMVEDGFAYEYTYREPYREQATYRAAERAARTVGRGLWGACTEIE